MQLQANNSDVEDYKIYVVTTDDHSLLLLKDVTL